PSSVNPESFPAKLWRLVNSPPFQSIRWDPSGQGLLIDEQQFMREVLSGGDGAAGAAELFKTKKFTSIIRQLNLYGFHKVASGLVVEQRPGPGAGGGCSAWALHHYHSPHFLRGRPDLLVYLKRLTASNKAKEAASPGLSSRQPRSYRQ
ncbi:HSF5 protein, partial [Brachypteracias leptosomus]|nr:HSF5 protein [Brachypteracias leptosomus]